MKYICVKCNEELSYEQAFNAHTHIIERNGDAVYVESVDDTWVGDCCQICTKKHAVNPFAFVLKVFSTIL